MTKNKIDYQVWLELVIALAIGIAAVAFVVSLNISVSHLFYGPNRFVTDYKPDYAPRGLINAFLDFCALFLTGCLVYFIAALPQFVALANPVAYFFSNGLVKDAKRQWAFYIFAGATIGGGPWIMADLLMYDPSRAQFVELWKDFPLTTLATGIGACSGTALKFRLMQITKNASIENSIE